MNDLQKSIEECKHEETQCEIQISVLTSKLENLRLTKRNLEVNQELARVTHAFVDMQDRIGYLLRANLSKESLLVKLRDVLTESHKEVV